jgi:hypothetical protein
MQVLISYDEGERLGRTSSCTRCSRDSTRCMDFLCFAWTDLTCTTWFPRFLFRDCAFLGGIDIAPAAMDGKDSGQNTIANTKHSFSLAMMSARKYPPYQQGHKVNTKKDVQQLLRCSDRRTGQALPTSNIAHSEHMPGGIYSMYLGKRLELLEGAKPIGCLNIQWFQYQTFQRFPVFGPTPGWLWGASFIVPSRKWELHVVADDGETLVQRRDPAGAFSLGRTHTFSEPESLVR